jgi:hypothetical protein
MPRSLLMLALLSVPAFVWAGHFTISPETVSVLRGQSSEDILVSYQPGAWIGNAELNLRINLDQLGWVQAQTIASPTSDYDTLCVVQNGALRAFATSRIAGPLPSSGPIPLCRFRLRSNLKAIRGIHTVVADPRAYTPSLVPAIATANDVRVVVR